MKSTERQQNRIILFNSCLLGGRCLSVARRCRNYHVINARGVWLLFGGVRHKRIWFQSALGSASPTTAPPLLIGAYQRHWIRRPHYIISSSRFYLGSYCFFVGLARLLIGLRCSLILFFSRFVKHKVLGVINIMRLLYYYASTIISSLCFIF